MVSHWLILVSLLLTYVIQAEKPSVVQKPIVYDEDRKALSLAYMRDHYGMTPKEPVITPSMIVVHWTAIPSFEKSFEAFYTSRLSNSRPDIQNAGALNVSVPYLIDRDGQIYQLMPDTLFARHVIGLNHAAIGIENVGSKAHPLTEAQLQSNIQLIRYLTHQYQIEYVIGHHEYQKFRNHPLWKEKNADYLTEKDDPGDEFMQKIRKHIQDLPLQPIPQ